MTATPPSYQLPAMMTLEDCEKLRDHLTASYDTAVTLNCAAVTRLTGLAAQIILAAKNSWQQRGLTFALADISPTCKDSIDMLGLAPALLQEGDAG